MLPLRQVIYQILCRIRRSFLRRPALRFFCFLHNASYHWFSFFSSGQGPHPKHAITNYHQFFIDHIDSSEDVIDLGCGRGELAHDLARHAHTVTGVDSHQPSIAHAQRTYHLPNLSFAVGDITTPLPNQHFHQAILSNVLEHIEHRIELLRTIQKYADKILIRVPLLTRDWITVYKKQHGLEYRLDDTHFIEYSPESFSAEIAAAGLSIAFWYIAFGELYAVCHPSHKPSPASPPATSSQPSPLIYSKPSSID